MADAPALTYPASPAPDAGLWSPPTTPQGTRLPEVPPPEAPAPPSEVNLGIRATGFPPIPESRTKDDRVPSSGMAPMDRRALAEAGLMAVASPGAMAARIREMEEQRERMGAESAGAQEVAITALDRRMALESQALDAMREYREGLRATRPEIPTLQKPPQLGDVQVRPWLDPAGKNALSMIAQTLGMLATGIGGIVNRAPKTALNQFREAAEAWRVNEVDRAQSNWQAFQGTMQRIREENQQALEVYTLKDKEYGSNLLAKQAAVVSALDELKLHDASVTAALLPFELGMQSAQQQISASGEILKHVTAFSAIMERYGRYGQDIPTSFWKAIGEAAGLDQAIKTEANPERKAHMQERLTVLKDAVQQYQQNMTKMADARAGLTFVGKALPGWVQQQQYVTRFQERLAKLDAAYRTLDAAGLLPRTPATLSGWSAWMQQQNPSAWKRPDVQEAVGVINTFFAPQTVGFDRTMLDDKGARFQQAYGTALKNPMMPRREFLGLARVWVEETDRVNQYNTLQGKWLQHMSEGAGLSVPNLTPPEE